MNRHGKYVKSLTAGFGLLVLIFDSKLATEGAVAGIELCIKTVIPSLFPFFVLSMLMTNSLEANNSRVLYCISRHLKIPTLASSVLIPAVLGGYPVGAKCVGDFYHRKLVSREEAERLLSFCNNAGPSFLFGMVSGFFPDRKMVWLLWLIHLFSAAMTAIAVPTENSVQSEKYSVSPKEKTEVILPAAKAMCMVCCWVVLFRILITFLKGWFLWSLPTWIQVMLTGCLELTNGCCALMQITDIRLRFVLCSCMLAFGGLCVLLQTASVTEGLSLRCYITGKALQITFSLILSCAVVRYRGIFFVGLLPVLVIISRKIQNRYRNPGTIPV